MIRVRTPSRLHFGLFSLPTANASPWLNGEGKAKLPQRRFGGVGLMIDRPGIELTVVEAKSWGAEGPLGERALEFAKTYCKAAGIDVAFQLTIASAAPEHTGLGTGTQLALAIGFGISGCRTNAPASCCSVAEMLGRGKRSAIGIYGFDFGGLIIEGGKAADSAISPLLHREDFPEDWRIVLITPRESQGVHGRRELDAFASLANQEIDDRTTDVLCRLVLLGMLPAVVEQDMCTFGEAIYEFNRRVGEMFRPAQFGTYSSARVEEIIKAARSMGVNGVGQSSWGPTVFAIVSKENANEVADWMRRQHDVEVIVTTANNNGGTIRSTE